MSKEDKRVMARARELWQQAGGSAAGPDAYVGRARELIAIEEHEKDTLKPVGAKARESVEDMPLASDDVLGSEGEPIEPTLAVENEGEFPTLTDQGEGEQVPHRPGAKR